MRILVVEDDTNLNRQLKDALTENGYAVATMHRPVNVDDPTMLAAVVAQISAVADKLP